MFPPNDHLTNQSKKAPCPPAVIIVEAIDMICRAFLLLPIWGGRVQVQPCGLSVLNYVVHRPCQIHDVLTMGFLVPGAVHH